MNRRWLVAVVVALGVVALEGAQADEGKIRGETDFRRYCASCHGLEARGDGPVAETLDPRPSDLTRIAARREGVFPEVEIQRIIDGRQPVRAHGAKQMPVWGKTFRGEFGPGPAGEAAARGTAWLIIRYLKAVQVEQE